MVEVHFEEEGVAVVGRRRRRCRCRRSRLRGGFGCVGFHDGENFNVWCYTLCFSGFWVFPMCSANFILHHRFLSLFHIGVGILNFLWTERYRNLNKISSLHPRSPHQADRARRRLDSRFSNRDSRSEFSSRLSNDRRRAQLWEKAHTALAAKKTQAQRR